MIVHFSFKFIHCHFLTKAYFPMVSGGTTVKGNTRDNNSTTSIAGIGVLVALLLAVSVGWIVSCVILLRRGQTVHKQQ